MQYAVNTHFYVRLLGLLLITGLIDGLIDGLVDGTDIKHARTLFPQSRSIGRD